MASIDARVGQREIDSAAGEVAAAGGMVGGGAEVATEALAGALWTDEVKKAWVDKQAEEV